MEVTIICDRCGQEVKGLKTEHFTGGFYDVSSGWWSQFADKHERYICDNCMWTDKRYIAVYGNPYFKTFGG